MVRFLKLLPTPQKQNFTQILHKLPPHFTSLSHYYIIQSTELLFKILTQHFQKNKIPTKQRKKSIPMFIDFLVRKQK